MSEAAAIQICSNAMIMLGRDPITSFDDGSAEAVIASALYENTVASALALHRWNFATDTKQASLLVGSPSGGVWQHKHLLPSGLITLDVVLPDTIEYDLYKNTEIWSDYDGEMWVEGRWRVEEESMPPYFIEYLEVRCAAKFCMPATDDESKHTKFSSMASELEKSAKNADSRQRKNIGMKKHPLIMVR